MKIEIINYNNLPVAIIDEFYKDEELLDVKNEILFLNSSGKKLRSPEHTGSATTITPNNEIIVKKKNLGLILDSVYLERNVSDILTLNRKVFDTPFINQLKGMHYFFTYIEKCNKDITKLHYYDDKDYYLSHNDDSVITCVSFFNIGEKKYRGGDLQIDNCVNIESVDNRCVIFPSILLHAVSIIDTNEQYKNLLHSGRYAISQFLYIEAK